MNNKKIGYLFPNLNGIALRHLRNIFLFNELNMKILITENNKKMLDNIFINKNNIKNKDIIFYNINNLLSIINKFDIIITCSNPDITTYFNSKNYNENIMKSIKPKVFYIHHGLVEYFNINNYKINNKKEYDAWKNRILYMNKHNIKFITCCKNLNNLLDNFNYNKKNKYKINSLPQFNLNKYMYNNFLDYKDSILIVISENENLNINNIEKLVNILQTKYPLKKIILKFKFRYNESTNCKNILEKKFKNIQFYFEEKYLFEFINSFLIIITSGGTSFMESLMYNKKVMLFQPNNRLKKFHNYPFKLDKLFIVDNFVLLQKSLNLLENEKYFDEKYNNEINKIINFHVGDKITDFKDDFIKIISSL
jgi:hypothetical protein